MADQRVADRALSAPSVTEGWFSFDAPRSSRWAVSDQRLGPSEYDMRNSQLPNLTGDLPSSTQAQDPLARRTYSVEEVARLLGISRSTAYECIRTGEIPSLRFRRRVVIPVAVVEA